MCRIQLFRERRKQTQECSKLANSGVTAHDWIHQGDDAKMTRNHIVKLLGLGFDFTFGM